MSHIHLTSAYLVPRLGWALATRPAVARPCFDGRCLRGLATLPFGLVCRIRIPRPPDGLADLLGGGMTSAHCSGIVELLGAGLAAIPLLAQLPAGLHNLVMAAVRAVERVGFVNSAMPGCYHTRPRNEVSSNFKRNPITAPWPAIRWDRAAGRGRSAWSRCWRVPATG